MQSSEEHSAAFFDRFQQEIRRGLGRDLGWDSKRHSGVHAYPGNRDHPNGYAKRCPACCDRTYTATVRRCLRQEEKATPEDFAT